MKVFCLLLSCNIVASELKDPICHSDECQIGSFSSEATICILYFIITEKTASGQHTDNYMDFKCYWQNIKRVEKYQKYISYITHYHIK